MTVKWTFNSTPTVHVVPILLDHFKDEYPTPFNIPIKICLSISVSVFQFPLYDIMFESSCFNAAPNI